MTRKMIFALFVPIIIVMVVADRLTKGWAAANLQLGVAGSGQGLIDFELVHNLGAAFGLGAGSGIVFIVMAIVICIAALIWLLVVKTHHVLEVVSLALVVSGGIGNLIDRITTVYVVDFMHFTFIDFPVFNIADVCVTCGVVLFIATLILTGAFSAKEEGER
jgi:signal peptidase II